MNILVTGGSGFIGANLCRQLLKEGHHVICLDNNYSGRMANIEELLFHPNFAFIKFDVCEPLLSQGVNTDFAGIQEIHPATRQIDQIYHLACPASPPFYQGAHAIKTTKTCVLGSLNVLDFALAHNAKVLYTSTSEIYGDPLEHPQKESYRGNVNPHGIRSCYDEGKRCGESLCFDYARHKGVKIKVVRIFNTYGPYMNPLDGRVVSNFICQALQGKDITVYGDGSQTRSFCYVDDLIRGLIKMMNSGDEFLGPVNLGNPHEFTVKELAQKVLAKIGSESKIVYRDLPQDDPCRRRPDITLAKEQLDWEPEVMLDEGLELSIEYFAKALQQMSLRNL